jgi:putative addiction module antidote
MAYTTKVRKIGNSLGVILPKEVLAELQVQEGQALYLNKSASGGLHITPTDKEFERQMEVGQDLIKRYRNTLRELAK